MEPSKGIKLEVALKYASGRYEKGKNSFFVQRETDSFLEIENFEMHPYFLIKVIKLVVVAVVVVVVVVKKAF